MHSATRVRSLAGSSADLRGVGAACQPSHCPPGIAPARVRCAGLLSSPALDRAAGGRGKGLEASSLGKEVSDMAQVTYEVRLALDGNHSVVVRSADPSQMQLGIAWAKATHAALSARYADAPVSDDKPEDEASVEPP